MSQIWRSALILCVAAVACHAGPTPLQTKEMPVQSATLKQGRESARFEVAKRAETMVLQITPIDPPGAEAVVFEITIDSATEPVQTISLYPPDQPGRFLIAVPTSSAKINVKALNARNERLPQYQLSLTALEQPR